MLVKNNSKADYVGKYVRINGGKVLDTDNLEKDQVAELEGFMKSYPCIAEIVAENKTPEQKKADDDKVRAELEKKLRAELEEKLRAEILAEMKEEKELDLSPKSNGKTKK